MLARFSLAAALCLALAVPAPASTPSLLGSWGASGAGDGQFYYPLGIATAPDGSVYVSDGTQNRIEKFTAGGGYLLQWTTMDRNGSPTRCAGLRVDRSGNVYVALNDDHAVAVYDPAGALLRRWGMGGMGAGQLDHPMDLAIAPDGTVFVTSSQGNRVLHFAPDSTTLGEFGAYGHGVGEFNGPHGIATDAAGNVYVTDTGNTCVEEWTATGAFVRQWGSPGTSPGCFRSIMGVAVDGRGNVWITDGFNGRVQKFTPTGDYLLSIAGGAYPDGVAVADDGTVYVLDETGPGVLMYFDAATPARTTTWGALKATYR